VNVSRLSGIIIAQDPPAYERVIEDTRITLTVGRLESRAYIGEASVWMDLDDDLLIRVMLIKSDGGEEMQYCAIHPSGVSEARFLVRAEFPDEYACRVYREDELMREITVAVR